VIDEEREVEKKTNERRSRFNVKEHCQDWRNNTRTWDALQ